MEKPYGIFWKNQGIVNTRQSKMYVESYVQNLNYFEQTQNISNEYDTDDSENSFVTANNSVD